ncbi:ATP-binding cassette domain-containing protein [Flavobacteriaceae bacterium S0825]|uniref:ABC transporter ATP-binding protein n=1 Tax=Gaetbulibacter sp. S0825 TaxID=2720084 RepID=UPI00142FF414|nr:ATP-binding cassette domain-containing protein [Gaetbulibacter sp. S0825]MCK0108595.1 ATP-binding cassette domain-containing protein [Flavobacteriaceae bacterium S0825]NIX64231.1 ATP-binding cassette domain-containing protein [Gaetbulibacter sp. S0825]
MLKTVDVTFSYTKESSFNFPDIELTSSQSLLILGKSGIGKTTLLHLLAGILSPDNGNIFINDTNITSIGSKKLDAFRGRHIGIVFQNTIAVSSLTVYENLQARLYFSGISKQKEAIENILNQLDLVSVKNQKPNTLSTGQLQRLGIALGVIHKPDIILADEPTSSLDDENCELVIDLLKSQAKKSNANLIIITHDQRIKNSFTNTIVL